MVRRTARFTWLLALGALVGCGTGQSTPAAQARPVPWSSIVGVLPQVGLPVAVPPIRLNAPACQPQNLKVVSVGPNQETQDDGVLVTIKNVGPQACIAWGPTAAVATGAGVAPVAGPVRPMPSYAHTAVTPPGGKVLERVDALVACASNPGGAVPPGRVYQAIRLTVGSSAQGGPGIGALTVSGLHLALPCGISASPFFTNNAPPPFNMGQVAHLRPSLVGPLTLTAVGGASAVAYTVMLSNPTASPIRLVPCPSYVERVSTSKWVIYRLNCQGAAPIPPHGAEGFAMRLAVPGLTAGQQVTVRWMLPLPVLGPVAQISGKVAG